MLVLDVLLDLPLLCLEKEFVFLFPFFLDHESLHVRKVNYVAILADHAEDVLDLFEVFMVLLESLQRGLLRVAPNNACLSDTAA